jgi:hypothetical protein
VRHQPLLREACACTRVRPLVPQHAKKRSSKVCMSPTTAHASISMHACESMRLQTCKQTYMRGLNTHADTHACTHHYPLLTRRHPHMHASPTTPHASNDMHACESRRIQTCKQGYKQRLNTHAHTRVHASPTTAHASTYMHACESRRLQTCKEGYKQGLSTHADTHACTRHQALLKQTATCTHVSLGASLHASKCTSKV